MARWKNTWNTCHAVHTFFNHRFLFLNGAMCIWLNQNIFLFFWIKQASVVAESAWVPLFSWFARVAACSLVSWRLQQMFGITALPTSTHNPSEWVTMIWFSWFSHSLSRFYIGFALHSAFILVWCQVLVSLFSWYLRWLPHELKKITHCWVAERNSSCHIQQVPELICQLSLAVQKKKIYFFPLLEGKIWNLFHTNMFSLSHWTTDFQIRCGSNPFTSTTSPNFQSGPRI